MAKISVTLTNAALQFFHSVLNTEKAKDVRTMRKINTLFRCIQPSVDECNKKREEIKKPFLETQEVSDPKTGAVSKKIIIPADKNREFSDKVDVLLEQKVTVEFDKESLSLAKTILEKIFTRPEVSDGLQGQEQLKYFEEGLVAFCEGLGIDPDSIETPAQKADDGKDNEEA